MPVGAVSNSVVQPDTGGIQPPNKNIKLDGGKDRKGNGVDDTDVSAADGSGERKLKGGGVPIGDGSSASREPPATGFGHDTTTKKEGADGGRTLHYLY